MCFLCVFLLLMFQKITKQLDKGVGGGGGVGDSGQFVFFSNVWIFLSTSVSGLWMHIDTIN